MTKLSTRVRAPIHTSKKIYTVDQSEPGFCLAAWIATFKESSKLNYFWLFKEEITLHREEYKTLFGEALFRDVLIDIKKYGSWIGFLS